MKIAVIGAGGVGGYFGARLAAAGEDVSFIQRGAHFLAMKERGLRVDSKLGNIELNTVKVTEDASEIGPVDIVLVAVKSGQTTKWSRKRSPPASLPFAPWREVWHRWSAFWATTNG